MASAERPPCEKPVKGGDRIPDLQLLRSGRLDFRNDFLEPCDDLLAGDILKKVTEVGD